MEILHEINTSLLVPGKALQKRYFHHKDVPSMEEAQSLLIIEHVVLNVEL